MVTDVISIATANIQSRIWPFDCHNYIWPEVIATNKTLHMAFTLAYLHMTLNHSIGQGQGRATFDWISQKRCQIGQVLLFPTHRKQHVAFRLAYLHLTMAHSKGHQGHAHFNWKYLANGDRWGTYCFLPTNRKLYMTLFTGIFTFDLGSFWRSKSRLWHFNYEYLTWWQIG